MGNYRITISEKQLQRILSEGVKVKLKEQYGNGFDDFLNGENSGGDIEKERWVKTRSEVYRNSSAFRRALDYIKDVDKRMYWDLIEMEYDEGCGY